MINLHVLDNLVTEHLQLELACANTLRHADFHTPPTDADVLVALHLIRTHVMHGRIDAAVTLSETLCPRPIADAHLLFNIRMHKLVELLHAAESIPHKQQQHARTAYHTALEAALTYSRQLAVYALDAFPEAYEAFVDAMQLFVTDDDDIASSAFIDARRRTLADELVSVVRLAVSARLSRLSFLLRYLVVVYLPFCTPVHNPQDDADAAPALQEVVRRLVEFHLPEDAPARRIVWRLDGAPVARHGVRPAFDEADVQALRERMCISREEALHALAFTDGDLSAAMRNELARIVTWPAFLRAMVVEYCAARGMPLLRFGSNKVDADAVVTTKACCPDCGGGRGARDDDDIGDELVFARASKDGRFVLVGDGGVSAAVMQASRVMQALREAVARNDGAQAVLNGLRNAVSLASFSVDEEPRLFFRLAQRQCVLHLEAGCLRLALGVLRTEVAPLAEGREALFAQLEATVMVLACGRVDNEGNPVDICRGGGEVDGLGDQAEQDVSLYRDLACEAWDKVEDHCAVDALAEEVFTSLQKRCGEPKLVTLLQGLVDTHGEWEKQNLFCDRLAGEFMIRDIVRHRDDDVSEGDGSAPGGRRRRRRRTRSGGWGGRRSCDGSRREGDGEGMDDQGRSRQRSHGAQGQSGDGGGGGGDGDGDGVSRLREGMILTLMEFLAVSRGEALSIIRNHPNATSAQTIMDSLLGSM